MELVISWDKRNCSARNSREIAHLEIDFPLKGVSQQEDDREQKSLSPPYSVYLVQKFLFGPFQKIFVDQTSKKCFFSRSI